MTPAGRAGCGPDARPTAPGTDAGFGLVEVLVAVVVLVVVLVATGSFFNGAVRTTADLSRKQSALALATRALEAVQALPPGAVLTGRSSADVAALRADQGVLDLTAQDVRGSTDPALLDSDPAATAASVPVVPLTTTTSVRRTTYTVRTAIAPCWLSPGTQVCGPVAATGSLAVLRATVVVSWGPASCTVRCRQSVSALLDGHVDPSFRLPTSQPIIRDVTPKTLTAGQTATVTADGSDIARGTSASLPAAAGTLDQVAPVGTDGKGFTARWAASTTPGRYTLSLLNPDTGRADFSLMTVLPRTVDDCATYDAATGRYWRDVLANDVPTTGTVAVVTTAGKGTWSTGTRSGRTTLEYAKHPSDSAGDTASATYTSTVNGQTSATATMRVTLGQTCT